MNAITVIYHVNQHRSKHTNFAKNINVTCDTNIKGVGLSKNRDGQ